MLCNYINTLPWTRLKVKGIQNQSEAGAKQREMLNRNFPKFDNGVEHNLVEE
jgi:hypothetical protein